jgi:hypothetical protein
MTMKQMTVEEAEQEIASLASRIGVLKSYVNSTYALNGQEPPYKDGVEATASMPSGGVAKPKLAAIAPDEFVGKPFAQSARMILERQKAAGMPGPMKADEIYEALKSGGYIFEVSGADPQKNGVKIALGKNSQTFFKIPNSDLFGLTEWYGVRKKAPGKKVDGAPNDNEATGEEVVPEVEAAAAE